MPSSTARRHRLCIIGGGGSCILVNSDSRLMQGLNGFEPGFRKISVRTTRSCSACPAVRGRCSPGSRHGACTKAKATARDTAQHRCDLLARMGLHLLLASGLHVPDQTPRQQPRDVKGSRGKLYLHRWASMAQLPKSRASKLWECLSG